jgi:hypothetical protein
MNGTSQTQQMCLYCGEAVADGDDSGAIINGPSHLECAFRSINGSVSHIERRCSCFITGSDEGDPPGMTLRQGARAAMAAYLKGRSGAG